MLSFREAGLCAAHEFREFFVDDLDDHLCGRQAGHDLRADGPFRDFRCEVLCDLVTYVRFEQSKSHFAHGFTYILFIQRAFAFQTLECTFKSV